MTDERLMELARQARENAYAPYSHYRVGAALLAEDGTVIHFPWGSRKSAFYWENLPDEMIVFLADGYDVTGRYPEAVQVFSGSRLNGYLIPTDEVLLSTP